MDKFSAVAARRIREASVASTRIALTYYRQHSPYMMEAGRKASKLVMKHARTAALKLQSEIERRGLMKKESLDRVNKGFNVLTSTTRKIVVVAIEHGKKVDWDKYMTHAKTTAKHMQSTVSKAIKAMNAEKKGLPAPPQKAISDKPPVIVVKKKDGDKKVDDKEVTKVELKKADSNVKKDGDAAKTSSTGEGISKKKKDDKKD